MKKIRKLFRDLKGDTSGNAMLLMAMGAPVLIGASGFAVDFAQWYMWKRELQYAVDQAAIAGAWASAEAATASTYETRATQEFNANLSLLTTMATAPAVSKADYGSGTDNSVVVTSTASASLPFSQMIMGSAATVAARSQATFEAATNWTTCLLAVDPTASDSLIFGGTASGSVTCGAGAISTATQAIRKNGNPPVQVSDIIAGGGIDAGLEVNGNIHANVSNLKDPFAGLTPPESTTPRTFSCPTATSASASSTTADVSTKTTTIYTYWQGKKQNQANTQVTYTGAGAKTGSSSSSAASGQSVANGTVEGSTVQVSQDSNWTGDNWPVSGSKNDKIFEKKTVTVDKTYTKVSSIGGSSGATATAGALLPGTYGDITITCDTSFSPGVYVVTGTLDFGQNNSVTGSDVLFVLKGAGSEKFKLNAKSKVNLTGIKESTLTNSYAMSSEDAEALAGMIIYDPNSTSDVQINGGADVMFDGIVYIPKRTAKFNGNSSVSGKCMMLAAGKLEFTGTNDLGSFCVPSGSTAIDIGGSTVSVRLVA